MVGRFAVSVVTMAGHGPHRTAIDNARLALTEAQHRAKERRDVDAALASITTSGGRAFRADGARTHTVVR